MVCDFCYRPGPAWSFMARSFTYALVLDDKAAVGRSVGAWLACTPCRQLVDAGDWQGLARRAVDADGRPDDADRAATEGVLVQMYTAFARARTTERAVALS